MPLKIINTASQRACITMWHHYTNFGIGKTSPFGGFEVRTDSPTHSSAEPVSGLVAESDCDGLLGKTVGFISGVTRSQGQSRSLEASWWVVVTSVTRLSLKIGSALSGEAAAGVYEDGKEMGLEAPFWSWVWAKSVPLLGGSEPVTSWESFLGKWEGESCGTALTVTGYSSSLELTEEVTPLGETCTTTFRPWSLWDSSTPMGVGELGLGLGWAGGSSSEGDSLSCPECSILLATSTFSVLFSSFNWMSLSLIL